MCCGVTSNILHAKHAKLPILNLKEQQEKYTFVSPKVKECASHQTVAQQKAGRSVA